MPKLSEVYKARARRVRVVTQALRKREPLVARAGTQQAVREQLYSVSSLKLSGRMLRSIRTNYLGGRSTVGFDSSVAPYAARRMRMTGTSKSGGHSLDLDINGALRRDTYPKIRAMRRASMRQIIGPGVRANL